MSITIQQIHLLKRISTTNPNVDDLPVNSDVTYLLKNELIEKRSGRVDFVKHAMKPWKPLEPVFIYAITHIGRKVLNNAWR